MTAFVLSVLALNIILWGVLLIRFKKLFSTDDIIADARNKMNRMQADIDSAADRDIYLSNEALKRLKKQVEDAEKTMEEFRAATERLHILIGQAEKKTSFKDAPRPSLNIISVTDDNPNFGTSSKKSFDAYKHNSVKPEKSDIKPGDAFELTSEQNSLFNSSDNSFFSDITNVTKEGAAYKQVPLFETRQVDNPGPSMEQASASVEQKGLSDIKQKQSEMEQTVKKLQEQGLSVEEIAKELACPVMEVELIIALNT